MALTNAGATLTTSWSDVLVVPPAQTARITQIQAAGIEAPQAETATLDLRWRDSSASSEHILITGLPVPRGTAISCLTGELALMPGDAIQAQSSRPSAISLTISAELI